MARNGSDLRIYWGSGRVILAGNDPRVPLILSLIHNEARPPEPAPEEDRGALARCEANLRAARASLRAVAAVARAAPGSGVEEALNDIAAMADAAARGAP